MCSIKGVSRVCSFGATTNLWRIEPYTSPPSETKKNSAIAIGIGHDVARYYKRAITIVEVDQLGGAMTEQLASLFSKETVRIFYLNGTNIYIAKVTHVNV